MEFLILFFFVGAGISGMIGMVIGDLGGKRNGGTGFLLGAGLGPVGWIIAAVLPPGVDAERPASAEDPRVRIARVEAELATLKMARMEAELAELRRAQAAPASAKAKRPDGEGTVPTYSLD